MKHKINKIIELYSSITNGKKIYAIEELYSIKNGEPNNYDNLYITYKNIKTTPKQLENHFNENNIKYEVDQDLWNDKDYNFNTYQLNGYVIRIYGNKAKKKCF